MSDLYLGFELCLHFLTDHTGRNSELFMHVVSGRFGLDLELSINFCPATFLLTQSDWCNVSSGQFCLEFESRTHVRHAKSHITDVDFSGQLVWTSEVLQSLPVAQLVTLLFLGINILFVGLCKWMAALNWRFWRSGEGKNAFRYLEPNTSLAFRRPSQCLLSLLFLQTHLDSLQLTQYHTQGVPGEMWNTSGECSLC